MCVRVWACVNACVGVLQVHPQFCVLFFLSWEGHLTPKWGASEQRKSLGGSEMLTRKLFFGWVRDSDYPYKKFRGRPSRKKQKKNSEFEMYLQHPPHATQ